MAAPLTSIPFSVDGRTAIVTGAGSADLALRPEAEKFVGEHSSKEKSPRAIFVKTDVTNWEQLTNMFEVADVAFGGADIVCPGAGVFEPHWSNFWHPPGSAAAKDRLLGSDGVGHYATLDINVTHPIRTTQLAISRWLNPPEGNNSGKVSPSNPKRVIHISSIAGQTQTFVAPIYAASKHAISGFIRSLEPLEATLGIRINGVAPGIIRTPLWTDHPEKISLFDDRLDAWVEPEEVAEAMLRCLEDEEVKGGWVLEVTKGKSRNITAIDCSGPGGPGGGISNAAVNVAEVFSWLGEKGWGVPK